jgi:hypothetical protein
MYRQNRKQYKTIFLLFLCFTRTSFMTTHNFTEQKAVFFCDNL